MRMTKVINIKDAPKDWQDNPEYVYIGRAGKGLDGYWGNPFRMFYSNQREDAIKLYINHLERRMISDKELLRRMSELKGKTLVCFCKPLACHGDVLVERVNSL